MKILITGGCGFIGTSLIAKLLTNYDHEIIILDNLCNSSLDFYKRLLSYFTGRNYDDLKVKVIEGDIRNFDLVLRVSKDCKYIINLAASTGIDISMKNPRFDLENNVIGTFNLLESSRLNKIEKILIASSGAVIGETIPPIKEDSLPKPISPYGASKLSTEAYANAFSHSFGFKSVVLRFSNVYGPGSSLKQSVVSKFIKDLMTKRENIIYGDGNQTRDFIYINDLTSAIEKSLFNEDIHNEVFQISTNLETKIIEINDMIIKSLKNLGYENLTTNFTNPRNGDVKKNYSDNTKALNMLNWKPNINIKDGIQETVQYFNLFKD